MRFKTLIVGYALALALLLFAQLIQTELNRIVRVLDLTHTIGASSRPMAAANSNISISGENRRYD